MNVTIGGMKLDWSTATQDEIIESINRMKKALNDTSRISIPVTTCFMRQCDWEQSVCRHMLCKIKKGPRKGKTRLQVVL